MLFYLSSPRLIASATISVMLMRHADSSGRETPRDKDSCVRWWSVDLRVHTAEGPSVSATFVLLAGMSGSDATKRVAQHLGCEADVADGEPIETRVGPDYGLKLPGAIFSDVSVEPLSEDHARILEQTGNTGEVQLRTIQFGPSS